MIGDPAEHGARRRAILDELNEHDAAIFVGAREALRNRDVEHEFRQDSDFWWLTGFDEPDSVLVLTPGAEHATTIFVPTRDEMAETWTGRRLGVERAPAALAIDRALPVEDFERELPGLLEGRARLFYALGSDAKVDAQVTSALFAGRRKRAVGPGYPDTLLDSALLTHERRLLKSEVERDRMRRAARLSARAQVEAMRRVHPGMMEGALRGVLEAVWREGGALRAAYPPIVAAGDNATVLHYTRLESRIADGDLVLIDAACEFEMYAADITRTFPANGVFSGPQRAVYEIVLDAQSAAVAAVVPGNTFQSAHDTALPIITQGLVDLKLIEGPVDDAIEEKRYERYFMHRTGHWLGLDVHDVGIYRRGEDWTPLRPGMVTTVEPGIYVPAADDSAPEALRGIGIRIEDDVLIVDGGQEVLSADAPKSISEIEALIRAGSD